MTIVTKMKVPVCILAMLAGSVFAGDGEQPIVPAEVTLDRPVDFQKDIQPILAANCLACHNTSTAESDLILETVMTTLKGGASGDTVVPGKPDESLLYQVAARVDEPAMPPLPNDVNAVALTPEQLGLLRQWIIEGAKAGDASGHSNIEWKEMNPQLRSVYSLDVAPYGRFIAAGRAGTVTIYDLLAPAQSQHLTDPALPGDKSAHRDYAHSVVFHPSGELIASAGYQEVKIWQRQINPAPLEHAVIIPGDAFSHSPALPENAQALIDSLPAEEKPATATVSDDGNLLLTVSGQGLARLWHVAEKRVIAELTSDLQLRRMLSHRESDRAVREARVAVVKGQTEEDQKRLDEQNAAVTSAREKHTQAITARDEAAKKQADTVAALIEPTKQLEAAPENEELKKQVEELKKAESEATKALENATAAVDSAARGIELAEQAVVRATQQLQTRQALLSKVEAVFQKTTRQRDALKERTPETLRAAAAQFFPGSKLAVTLGVDGDIRLWNTEDGTPVDTLSTGLTFSTGQPQIRVTDGWLHIRVSDGTVLGVDLFPPWKLIQQLGAPNPASASVFSDRVLALAFSPDGQRLAAGGGQPSRSGQLMIWDTSDWTVERVIDDAHSDTIYGLDFSADGELLASAAADKFVKVFKLDDGSLFRSYEGHTHHVMDVSWKADRASLVSAGADNVIKVWDVETGEQRKTISTYSKQVTSVQFVGLENTFISSSGDRRVILLKADDGAAVREFTGNPDYVHCSAVTPDGRWVVAGGEDGVVRVWNGTDGSQLTVFEN